MRSEELLQNKVALVTGGSEGIGAALTRVLAQEGAFVVAVARNERRLAEVMDSLPEDCRDRITTVAADARNEDEVRQAVSLTLERHGRVDALLNCAGVNMSEPTRVEAIRMKEWERIVGTNLTGTFLFCREVLPSMIAQASGYIINVLSTAAYRGWKEFSPYSASKFGVRALTEALMEEHRSTGIRISSISPGPVNTNIWSHKTRHVSEEERRGMLQTDDIVRIVLFLLTTPPHVLIDNITVTPRRPIG